MFQLTLLLPFLVQSSAILLPGHCPTVPRSHYFNYSIKYLRPLAITPFLSTDSHVFNEVLQMDFQYGGFNPFKALQGQPLQRITATMIGISQDVYLMTSELRDHGNYPSACHKRISETVHYWQDEDTLVLWDCKEIVEIKSDLKHDEAWVVLVNVLRKKDLNPIEHTKVTFQRLNLTMIKIVDPNYIFDWPVGREEKKITDTRLSCFENEEGAKPPNRKEKGSMPSMLLGMILISFCVIFPMALFVANQIWSR